VSTARSFRAAVYAIVRRIPRGEVATYGQVAVLAGRDRAARAVGGAMRSCPDDVPWHRVVNAQGGISRRRRDVGMLTQRIRLEQEGIKLRRGKVWLSRFQWEPIAHSRVRARAVRNRVRSSREWGVMGGPERPPHR
jgi:methylated-DNA-protein-cysteine methyltransferase related protein